MKLKLTLLLGAVLSAVLPSANAALLFFEDFSGSNFVVGSSVQGVTSNSVGAVGQNGTWHDRDLTNYSNAIRSETLSYTGGSINMTGSGKVLEITASAAQTGTFAVGVDLGTAITPVAVGSGNTLYMSTLVRYTGNIANDNNTFGSLTGTITGASTTGPKAGFASTNAQFALAPTNLATNLTASGTNSAADTTYLYIWGLQSDGSNWTNISSWVNPTTSTPGTPLQSYAITATNSSLVSVAFTAATLDGGETIRWGDTRISTSWADVTAVPEPTTWALLAGSLTALMVFRRRRG